MIKAVTERFVPGGIPLWLTNIGLNVPLFFLALKFKGKRFIWRTVVGTVLLSAWIYVIPAIDLTQQDYFLAAIFGGVIGGAGMGLILLARSTTGGTELLAVLIQHFVRHYSVVQIMQVLDAMIVLTGLYLFGIKAGMYAIVAIFVTTKVSDGLWKDLSIPSQRSSLQTSMKKWQKRSCLSWTVEQPVYMQKECIPVMKSACFTVLFPRNRS